MRRASVVLSYLVCSSLVLGLSACSDSDNGGPSNGEVSITFTDAASDELSVFEIDVTRVTFHRVNGSDVSLLPRRARIDFAALDDLADLVVGRGMPPGAYTGMTLTLDFSTAAVYLKDGTTPAAVLDVDGNAITGPLDVALTFARAHHPRVVVNRHHLWMVDLDLDQAVLPDTAANRVTFLPVLTATVDPGNPKTIGASGLLTEVDAASGRFRLARLASDGVVLGTIDVAVRAQTVYQIDGAVHTGSAGLAALAGLPTGTTHAFVQGTLSGSTRLLHADAVEAGTGVLGGDQDVVEGLITGRDNSAAQDCALTVLGHSRTTGGARMFNTSHTVNVRFGVTRVVRRGDGTALDTDYLNVGQRVQVFGTLTGTALDATASTSIARQLRTSIFGTAAGPVVGNTLTLDLARIGVRPVGAFQFTVGGIVEAVPGAYTVDTGNLPTPGIAAGTRVQAIGFVNRVGVAGDANFTAQALVNRSTSKQLELCIWTPPSPTAITSANASAITLDVSAALLKRVEDGFASLNLANTPAPTIAPRSTTGNYRILQQGAGVEVHYSFDTFTAEVTARLATHPVHAVMAFGDFTELTQVMAADTVTVHLR